MMPPSTFQLAVGVTPIGTNQIGADVNENVSAGGSAIVGFPREAMIAFASGGLASSSQILSVTLERPFKG